MTFSTLYWRCYNSCTRIRSLLRVNTLLRSTWFAQLTNYRGTIVHAFPRKTRLLKLFRWLIVRLIETWSFLLFFGFPAFRRRTRAEKFRKRWNSKVPSSAARSLLSLLLMTLVLDGHAETMRRWSSTFLSSACQRTIFVYLIFSYRAWGANIGVSQEWQMVTVPTGTLATKKSGKSIITDQTDRARDWEMAFVKL